MVESALDFSLHKHSKKQLVISVSFPDVEGALTPTVTAAFIDAVCALWQVKESALTHKTFAINNKCIAGFLPSYYIPHLFHFTNIQKELWRKIDKPYLSNLDR